MQHLHLKSYDGTEAAAAAAELASWLRAGAIGIVPTETVPGLVCAWFGPDSVTRLCASKGRDPQQKCQYLLSDLRQAAMLSVPASAELKALAAACWPGALTVVASAGSDTAGLRIPDHPWLRRVIELVGRPLTATSANPPGGDPRLSAARDYRDLPGPIDFVVAGPPGAGTASTVCRISPFEILRPGPVSEDTLRAILEKVGARP